MYCILLPAIYLIICSFTDIKSMKISLPLSLMFSLTGILLSLFSLTNHQNIFDLILSVSAGLLIILASFISRGSIGIGDGFIISVIGCFHSSWITVCVIAYSFFIAAVFCLILILLKKQSKGVKIPFAPFILIGYIFNFLTSVKLI
ncbi:MAG: prepilin peptidase [Lachnospiraceae bacterium]